MATKRYRISTQRADNKSKFIWAKSMKQAKEFTEKELNIPKKYIYAQRSRS